MVIGLTGGIASGKTTVSNMLRNMGAVVIDADKIAREVVEPHEPAWVKIRERFGEEVFHQDGQLNRQRLGSIVFDDTQARIDLNKITHPAIRKRMQEKKEQAIEKGTKWVVLDIPLLFESELEYMVDKVLVVYVPQEIQKQRLMSRDQLEEERALQRMESQMPIDQKKDKGHAYIDNSGTIQQSKKQLEKIINSWSTEEKT